MYVYEITPEQWGRMQRPENVSLNGDFLERNGIPIAVAFEHRYAQHYTIYTEDPELRRALESVGSQGAYERTPHPDHSEDFPLSNIMNCCRLLKATMQEV